MYIHTDTKFCVLLIRITLYRLLKCLFKSLVRTHTDILIRILWCNGFYNFSCFQIILFIYCYHSTFYLIFFTLFQTPEGKEPSIPFRLWQRYPWCRWLTMRHVMLSCFIAIKLQQQAMSQHSLTKTMLTKWWSRTGSVIAYFTAQPTHAYSWIPVSQKSSFVC